MTGFSTWLLGLSQWNQNSLFEPQLLGLIYQFVAPWQLKRVKSATFPQAIHFHSQLVMKDNILYVGFVGDELYWVNPDTGETSCMAFTMQPQLSPLENLRVKTYTYHPQKQQWILYVYRPVDRRYHWEIYDLQGQLVRDLGSRDQYLDQLQCFHIHPVLGCLMACDERIFSVDYVTGDATIWYTGADDPEIDWFHSHPSLPAVFVSTYDDDNNARLTLWNNSKEQLFQIPCEECSAFLWSPTFQGIFEWTGRNEVKLWSAEGVEDTSHKFYQWPCHTGSQVLEFNRRLYEFPVEFFALGRTTSGVKTLQMYAFVDRPIKKKKQTKVTPPAQPR